MRKLLLFIAFFALLLITGCNGSLKWVPNESTNASRLNDNDTQRKIAVVKARKMFKIALDEDVHQPYLMSILVAFLEENNIDANEISIFIDMEMLREFAKPFPESVDSKPPSMMVKK